MVRSVVAFTLLLNISFTTYRFGTYCRLHSPFLQLKFMLQVDSKVKKTVILQTFSEHLKFINHSVATVHTPTDCYNHCTNMYNKTTPCSVADESTFAYISSSSVK